SSGNHASVAHLVPVIGSQSKQHFCYIKKVRKVPIRNRQTANNSSLILLSATRPFSIRYSIAGIFILYNISLNVQRSPSLQLSLTKRLLEDVMGIIIPYNRPGPDLFQEYFLLAGVRPAGRRFFQVVFNVLSCKKDYQVL